VPHALQAAWVVTATLKEFDAGQRLSPASIWAARSRK
jgi:hypothetical protein